MIFVKKEEDSLKEKLKPKNLSKKFSNKFNLSIFLGIFLLVILIFLFVFNSPSFLQDKKYKNSFDCGDGTFSNTCSLIKPYFCLEGKLIEQASNCGCPENFESDEELCTSEYNTNSKQISLKYILRGEIYEFNYTVYGGVADYLANSSKIIQYTNGEKPFRGDFKLKAINNPVQREFLLPLVVMIQDITKDKDDQVRIAISIVQNIPFGESEKRTILTKTQNVTYERFPYEVLYEYQGVCGEKSELLAFLLREMGYGIVFFYNNPENHESLGIKCPLEYSFDNSGYCLIETTGPSIMTDEGIEYVGGIKLISKPELILISQGDALGKDMYEYDDAKSMKKIRAALENKFFINPYKYFKFKSLNKKYGLVEVYNP